MPDHMEALPFGLIVLVALFVVYALRKTNEIAELRGLVRGIEHGTTTGQNHGQIDHLLSMISRSQQGYRDLIDTFEHLLFSLTIDGHILTVNRSFVDLLDLTYADVIGRSVNELFEFPGSASRMTTDRPLEHFLEQRSWTGMLCVRLRQKGSTHYFDCILHAITREGVVQGISGLARDITRERENETRFTELFQTLREGVYLASADDRIMEVNPALANMLGFAGKEEMINIELSSMYRNAEDREAETGKLEDLGFLRAREITLKHQQEDRDVVVLHTSTVIRDSAGKFVRYQGTFVDITEQREMERRLHREQEFARHLMDSFPDIVMAVDAEARYTFASPQILDALGYRPEELLGEKLGDRTDPHDRVELLKLFDDLIAGRRSDGLLEFRARHKNGTWRLFRASARSLHDEKGLPAGIIISARDITDQQLKEQHLIQSERLAAMGQMIAGVAHELNNPLTAILGVTELMRDQTTDENSRRHLDLAHNQARRAADIVQSLLDFSRPSRPHNSLLHLSDLLQHTLQLQDHSLRANHIDVDLKPRPDLPPVLGDASQLTQVFLNLIVNAEQAIREVRDHGTLRIRLAVVDGNMSITFQDDGVGIHRDALPRIFDPFFTTKRPGRGTGLGLSICMAIVREHNGDISAQPLPDGGSVFTVSLPLCTQETLLVEANPAAPPAVELPASSPALFSGKRILVVDDQESIRDLVGQSLGARGFSVDCAGSSKVALELAARHSYDAILCDLHLESETGLTVSGFEICDCIRRNLASRIAVQPVYIFMSGDLVDPKVNEHAGHQASRFLQKPFGIADLYSLLAEALCPDMTLQPKNNSSN